MTVTVFHSNPQAWVEAQHSRNASLSQALSSSVITISRDGPGRKAGGKQMEESDEMSPAVSKGKEQPRDESKELQMRAGVLTQAY